LAGPGSYLIGEEEKKEVLEVMESGYLSRYGDPDDKNFKRKVATFEEEFAKYLGLKHSILLNGGTSALLTSLTALGIGPGDEVIVPGFTFVASISSIIYARAIPVLAEIDESLTIDPEDIKRKITKRTKAIMPVHMLGNPCNMEKIMGIAREKNLLVIEDACQAVGGLYKGKKLGSIGNVGAYSFNWYKTITTGDGGAIATDDDFIYEKAFAFHDQGHRPYRFGQEVGKRAILGISFKVNELTGAIALAQLRKLDKIVNTLRENKKILKESIINPQIFNFRKINDSGECATILSLIFKEKSKAEKFAQKLNGKTLFNSGWHNYNYMEHLIGKKMPTDFNCPFECKEYGKNMKYYQNMLPQTDDILSRSVNISVGVVDKVLTVGTGINILSSKSDIEKVTGIINKAIKEIS
jgi:dTDP-4-amino-4,6-dideoxygalactose transaminase